MNKVLLSGRLVADPKFHAGQNGGVCFMTIAAEEGWNKAKKAKNVEFIDVVVFGSVGEFAANNLKKGYLVEGYGYIKNGSYEKDGKKVYQTSIVLREVELLSKPKVGVNNGR